MEARQFGSVLTKLRGWCLPVMVAPGAEDLQTNDMTISAKFTRPLESDSRRLVMAFDRTYIETSMQLFQADSGSAMSGGRPEQFCCYLILFALLLKERAKHTQNTCNCKGILYNLVCFCFAIVLLMSWSLNRLMSCPTLFAGAHRPQGFAEADESLLPIRRDRADQCFKTSDVKRATEMESFLIWDCTRRKSVAYEYAAYPCMAAASKDDRLERIIESSKHMRGKWETLARTDLVLQHASSTKFLIADGHGSHRWLHDLLLGVPISLDHSLLEHLPFWSSITYEELPMVCFPLPWRNVILEGGDSFHYLPGRVCPKIAQIVPTYVV